METGDTLTTGAYEYLLGKRLTLREHVSRNVFLRGAVLLWFSLRLVSALLKCEVLSLCVIFICSVLMVTCVCGFVEQ